MKRCENCGASVKDEMRFCTTCGHQFQEELQRVCANCGTKLNNGVKFCISCGTPVTDAKKPEEPEKLEEYTYEEYEVPEKKSNKGLVALLVSLLIVLIVSVAAAGILIWQNNQESDSKEEETKQEENVKDEKEDKKKKKDEDKDEEEPVISKKDVVEDVVETYIQDNDLKYDVSVAIFDNLTGERYTTKRADDSYTAWGLYLPIYLAYGEGNCDPDVLVNILSSDPAKCNASANEAMEDMGGFDELNEILEYYYGTSSTTYGRMFGDTTATSDNYTTANDAVVFLSQLNETGQYGNLEYDLNAFGIDAPANTSVYAHVGTENRNVRDQLNLFAIVKGENSDYCVAILTRNANGDYISELLDTIHAEMEAEV